ncbi:hypothetical protein GW17_00047810 [Ensete ventricosum]|nr:hypothetical protein GW17_00047810 [Ensete ventricosum]
MCNNRISGFVPKLALSTKSSGFVPEFTLSAKSQAQFLSPCSVGSIFELLLGWINFRALARSDQLPLRSVPEPLLGRINSRAPARSDQLPLQSVPELLLGRISSHSDQFLSPCSVGSAPAPISSRAPAQSDQFSSPYSVGSIPELLLGLISSSSDQFSIPCSVGSIPEPRLGRINSRIRSPTSSSPELRSVRSVPEPPLGTSSTSPQASDSAQDLIFSTLIGHLEKVFQGGKNDMADVDLVATYSRPRTTGPPTWPTRREKSIWRRYGGVSGRIVDLAQVRLTPLTCRRTSHRKDDERGREVRQHGVSDRPELQHSNSRPPKLDPGFHPSDQAPTPHRDDRGRASAHGLEPAVLTR